MEQKEQWLLTKTNKELKAILKARKQKVSGNKGELIDRLLGREKKNLKPIAQSAAAKLLQRDIFEKKDRQDHDDSPLDAEALFYLRVQYQRYPLDEFEALVVKLREKDTATRQQAAIDDEEVAKQLQHIGGMEEKTFWGYQSWRNHPGKPILRQQMDDALHLELGPSQLLLTHPVEYAGLDSKVLGKRIAQEIKARKQANYNARKEAMADDDSRGDDVSEWSEDDDLVS